jgi:hypothetical protein
MWRSLLTLLLAAALASMVATAGFILLAGGTHIFEPTRFTLAITAGTMIFTVPGAIMLAGLQAILGKRGLGRGHRDALVALFAAVAGAAILMLISPKMVGVGAVYGLTTAVALIGLQRLVAVAGTPAA